MLHEATKILQNLPGAAQTIPAVAARGNCRSGFRRAVRPRRGLTGCGAEVKTALRNT